MYISSACDVVIEVTRRCNMCCAHCLRGDAEAVDIQERYIDAFLDSFANAGYISSLTFTGGEISLNIPAIRYTLAFNNGSMNWAGSSPALWHYGEGHDINYAKALAKIRKFKDADIGERFNMQLDDAFKQYAKNGYLVD